MEKGRVCYRKFEIKTELRRRVGLKSLPRFTVFIIGILSRTKDCSSLELKELKSTVMAMAREKCALTCKRAECKARVTKYR